MFVHFNSNHGISNCSNSTSFPTIQAIDLSPTNHQSICSRVSLQYDRGSQASAAVNKRTVYYM
jgi:hypothetical protein